LGIGFTGSDGAIIMFDLTNRDSFKSVLKWMYLFSSTTEISCGCSKNIVVCGSKCDKEKDRCVSHEEIRKLIEETGVKYCEISSKSNYNFKKPFEEMINLLTNQIDTHLN
jgi:Ras-related protein Rab-21